MKYLFLLLLYCISINANEIDTLLANYQTESELSLKTKDESAGHLTVYTRDDLELMQVETLQDILKSIPFFRYLENRIAQPDLLNIDPVLSSSKSVRVYLNQNELILPIFGSGISLFGNIDMDFIDHVEIYEGFSSFEFGIEPASIIIRLYSKVAKRDAGSRVKFLTASHGSHKENVYTSGFSNDLEYFIYANHSSNNQDVYTLNSESLKRNHQKNHFYASLSNDTQKLELQALSAQNDAFVGSVPYALPQDAQVKNKFVNVAYSANLYNKSLLLKLSYIQTDSVYNAKYRTALPIALGGYSQVEQRSKGSVLTAIIEKKYQFDAHKLNVGLQVRRKTFDFSDLKYDGVQTPYNQVYKKEDIYSFILEDTIALSAHHKLGLFFMEQRYKELENDVVRQFNLSHIYSDNQLIFKTFVSRQMFEPDPYTTAQDHTGNPSLKPEGYLAFTQEMNYQRAQTLYKLVYGYTKIKNFLIPNSNGVMQNAQEKMKIYYAQASADYKFRKKDKLQFQFDYQKFLPFEGKGTIHHYNYLLRMINSVAKYDFFNEVVINHGYENLKTGYDYSAGVTYRHTKDLHFKLKGENIFNRGLTRKYTYNILSGAKIEVPVIEQKFMLSMEYLF